MGREPWATVSLARRLDASRRSGTEVFDTLVRRSDRMHSGPGEDGAPVVLRNVCGRTYENVRAELEALTTGFAGERQEVDNA